MTDRNRYQTSQVAETIGVSVSTVRRLAGRYAQFLSESASPRPGGRRQFCDEDVTTLREANRLTLAGMEEEEIARRLAAGVTLPAQAVTAPPQPPDTLSQLPPLRIDATDLVEPMHRLAAAQDAQTAALARLASAEEASAAAARFQAEQQAAHVDALQEHARAMDRLSDRLVWIVAALVAIVLITVAVAVGWIG